jgi:predicted nuclease of predicted toxin-antitoxin system
VKPLEYPLLADENIHPLVVAALRKQGKRVESVVELGIAGKSDVDLLRVAHGRGAVIVTHDSDFARLAIRASEQFTGIVYLRPCHIDPAFVLDILGVIESTSVDVETPFIVIAVRRGDRIKVRLRRGGP